MAELTLLQPSSQSTVASLPTGLGWETIDLEHNHIYIGGDELPLAKGTIDGEPTVIFASLPSVASKAILDRLALFAYHANAPWGIVTDELGFSVINSQWTADGNWYRLPRVPWTEERRRAEIASAFSPDGMLRQEITSICTDLKEPDGFLMSVDDNLVSRLDNWRDEALKYARSSTKLDERLQTFYAQAFVLRTVEDRSLDNRVFPLSDALSDGSRFDSSSWLSVLQTAREYVGSNLFADDTTVDMPSSVLSGVITDLYKPRGLPQQDARYNFKWIDADVLGTAYEKYLGTVLHEAPLPAQNELFDQPHRGTDRRSIRKMVGAFYTPKYITNFITTSTINDFYSTHDRREIPRIIDFSCGSGSFLVAAIDKLLRHLRSDTPTEPWGRKLLEGKYVCGVDTDEKAVTAARLHLWQRLLEEPEALPLPSLDEVVIEADGLDTETWGAISKKYEIVLGNPPFLATGFVSNRDTIEARYRAAKGRYDYSSLFIEQGISVLSDSGCLGMVVPNRLFTNRSAAAIRSVISEETELKKVVDFKATKPFEASAYVGCIITRKSNASDKAGYVEVVEVEDLHEDFLASQLLTAPGSDASAGSGVRHFRSRRPSGSGPWLLLSEEERLQRVRIEEISRRLNELADIPQGIRTGANDFFFVELVSSDGDGLSQVQNGFGDAFLIESSLLKKCVSGTQVQKYMQFNAVSRIIYPYVRNVAISQATLEVDYPHAYKYFLANREVLGARASLARAGRRFYELVWPRDATWLERPKLLTRDLARSVSFAIDPEGDIYLAGGTAVVPHDPEMLFALFAYLNSNFVNDIVEQTTPAFSGNYQKFEPHTLASIPVLNDVLDDNTTLASLDLFGRQLAGQEPYSARVVEIERRIDEILQTANDRPMPAGSES